MPEDSRAATKQDLNELRDQLTEQMRGQITELREEVRNQITEVREQITSEVRGQIIEVRDQLVEQMRDMQTEVLRAFHDWAQPVEIKLRAIPPLDQRLGLLEERVSRLERGQIQH